MKQIEVVNPLEKIINQEELRLLSIRKAGKILGIRYEHMVKLVNAGRIKAIPIGRRVKVPYRNLIDFVESNRNHIITYHDPVPAEEVHNKIDLIIRECTI